MRTVRLLVLLPAVCVLASCTQISNKVIAGEKDNLMPLAEGNEWVYNDTANLTKKINADRVRRVGGKIDVGGKQMWSVTEATVDGDEPFKMAYLQNSEGVFFHNFDGAAKRDALNQILRYPVRMNDTWKVDLDMLSGGHMDKDHWEHTVVGWETLKVPAGTFKAIRIDSTNTMGAQENDVQLYIRHWFAPGVGMVKYTTGQGPRTAERTLELKKYTIKGR